MFSTKHYETLVFLGARLRRAHFFLRACDYYLKICTSAIIAIHEGIDVCMLMVNCFLCAASAAQMKKYQLLRGTDASLSMLKFEFNLCAACCEKSIT